MDTPRFVYKYVGPERVDIFSNERLCFSPPDRLNDLFDVRPYVAPVRDRKFLGKHEKEAQKTIVAALRIRNPSLGKREAWRMAKQGTAGSVDHMIDRAESMAAQFGEDLYANLNATFGLLCLSEANDEPLLWAYYTREHAGFAIEFRTEHESFRKLGELVKVEYTEEFPVYDPARGARGFWRRKLNRFQHEREWRIARLLSECEKRSHINPPVYLSPISKDCISRVLLGFRCSTETITAIRKAFEPRSIELVRVKPDGWGILRFQSVT